MRRSTLICGLCGGLLGVAAVFAMRFAPLANEKILAVLTFPGWFPLLMLDGHVLTPFLPVYVLNALAYASAAALSAAVWTRRRAPARCFHRRQSPRVGRCQECDYDLTGNVSGVCA